MIRKLLLLLTLVVSTGLLNAQVENHFSTVEKLKNLEATTEGRLGVFALNTASGQCVEYRSDEIFPLGCTSKVIGVGTVLKKSISDPSLLDTKVYFSRDDLVTWSPITKNYVSEGMTIKDLCAASISFSDNTAMNLLLKAIDGLEGMNRFARSIGNLTFRQDHDWPLEAFSGGLNNVQDSSSPKAMVESLFSLTLGSVFDSHHRDLLIGWLKETKTGSARIKAGIPNGWLVGNKTGTGVVYGTTNDLAIIWPPNHAPLLLGVYYTCADKQSVKREDVVSAVARLMVEEWISTDSGLSEGS